MSPLEIVPLGTLRPDQLVLVGGKAAHLATMIQAGLPVPPGICVTIPAFKRFLEHSLILAELERTHPAQTPPHPEVSRWLAAIRNRILQATLPPELQESLRRAWGSLLKSYPNAAVAVRSSGRSEDSSDASFAGQYETVLNVRHFDGLCLAVRQVWSSYFSEGAQGYRQARGESLGELGLAVLIQVMIVPEVSGVLFTLNPLNGSKREMLLEAGYGLGEAFVSGQLCPDTFYLSRPRFPWQRPHIEIQGSHLADKAHKLGPAADGSQRLQLTEVVGPMRLRPSLQADQARRIGRLGLRLERIFHAPQDVEWAIDARGKLFLLQARPVTALKSRAYRRRDTLLWTRRIAGERWTEPATPLGWSLLAPVFDHFIYFEDVATRYLHGTAPTRMINGYPYFNISIFRHLIWKVLGLAPPQFILEFFPREEQEAMLAAPSIVPNLPLVTDIFREVFRTRRWRRYHYNFLTNYSAWNEFLPTFLEGIRGLTEQPQSPEEARAVLELGQQWIKAYVKIHLLSLLFANLYYQLLSSLLYRWIGPECAQLLSDLMAYPAENKTVEANRALFQLAAQASVQPALRERLLAEGAPISPASLLELPGGPAFVSHLESFLQQYGHRSGASWEIFVPRWVDQPERVLQMVSSYLRSSATESPEQLEARRNLARQKAEQRVLEAVGRLHPLRQSTLRYVLKETQAYMVLRENQRFYFELLLLRIKRAGEQLGRLWVEQGLLETYTDVALLSLQDIDAVLKGELGGESLRARVVERAHAREVALSTPPPVFLEGDEILTPLNSIPGRTLSGLGISPARATGRVKVLEHWSQVEKFQPGDILVTRATDPGWTFLFLTAGGLVTEMGSLLSHGAVVAREYGLPAVVNVPDATTRLKDGQHVTVDGFRGVVFVHEDVLPEVAPPAG